MKNIIKTISILYFLSTNLSFSQSSMNRILNTGKRLYVSSENLAWNVSDTLTIFNHNFLGKFIDSVGTKFFISNDIIPGRDYTSTEGVFIIEKAPIFINYSLSSFKDEDIQNEAIRISIFFDEEIYTLIFIRDELISISTYWKTFSSWNEGRYYSRGTTKYTLDKIQFNDETLKVKLDYMRMNSYTLVGGGKRSEQEVYNSIFR